MMNAELGRRSESDGWREGTGLETKRRRDEKTKRQRDQEAKRPRGKETKRLKD
jgi:hypothetical protein